MRTHLQSTKLILLDFSIPRVPAILGWESHNQAGLRGGGFKHILNNYEKCLRICFTQELTNFIRPTKAAENYPASLSIGGARDLGLLALEQWREVGASILLLLLRLKQSIPLQSQRITPLKISPLIQCQYFRHLALGWFNL